MRERDKMKTDNTQLKQVSLFDITQHHKKDNAQRTLFDTNAFISNNKARDKALSFFERVKNVHSF